MCLYIVGIGPGKPEGMTLEAEAVLENCEIIVGYTVYTGLLKDRFPEKEYYSTPMKQEIERCRWALRQAADGKETALVCSGDAGIYGLAGLVFQLSGEMEESPEIRVIPGVTAASSGGALLGAPLGHDFAVISLSDLLTDPAVIADRLRFAARGDMVLCLYNPSSKKRADHLKAACDIILAYRSPETVCGYAKNIGREGEVTGILSLRELREFQTDMFTTVYIGSSSTLRVGDHMVTPRGYRMVRPGPCETKAGTLQENRTAVSGRVIIFGGTTEGRLLYEHCREQGIPVSVYVATAYGCRILESRDGPESGAENKRNEKAEQERIHTGRLTRSEMEAAMRRERAFLVLDATHPFALEATENIRAACGTLGIPCHRIRRELPEPDDTPETLCFDSIEEVVSFLKNREGNILVTTGSKDLFLYTALPDYQKRLYVRVLPDVETIAACMGLGITGRHLSAMQGPFSEEMNIGYIREFSIRWVVTKQSGAVGGFYEKQNAARRTGAALLVIRKKNKKETGIGLKEAIEILEELK